MCHLPLAAPPSKVKNPGNKEQRPSGGKVETDV